MLDKSPAPDTKSGSSVEARLSERRAEIEMSLAVVSTLKPADRRFTAAVLMGYSLKDAYLYAKPEYDGKNARKMGWEWRQKPAIQAAIDEYFHQKEMTPRRAVALLSEKAEFDLTRYMRYVRDDTGRITDVWIDVEAIGNDGYGHVLLGTKYDRNGRLMIEFEKSLPALEDVMKYLGLFKERTETLDWRDEIVEMLQNGRITADDVANEFEPEDAKELIARANLARKGGG
jgi:hypothetical protein